MFRQAIATFGRISPAARGGLLNRAVQNARSSPAVQIRAFRTSPWLSQEARPSSKPLLISTRVKGATWLTFSAFAVAAAGVLYLYAEEKKKAEKEKEAAMKAKETMSVGKPKIGGPFSLVDENNVRRTEQDFLGKYTLVYFGFTYCPDICPIELTKMADALHSIEKEPDGKKIVDAIQPLFISVDPKRDTLEQIRLYTKEFYPKLLGMTGTKEEVGAAAKAYRVYFSTSQFDDHEANDDYLVDHSIFIYFMGPDGKLLDYFGQNKKMEEMRDAILQHVRQGLSSAS